MNRLNKGEQIFLGASGLLFILALFPMWMSVKAGPISDSGAAWGNYGIWGKIMMLSALAGVVIAGLKLLGQSVSVPAVAWVGLGGLATLMLLLMVVLGPDDRGVEGLFGIEVNRGFLVFVGLVLGAAMTYGGYLAMQAEGTTTTGTPPPVA